MTVVFAIAGSFLVLLTLPGTIELAMVTIAAMLPPRRPKAASCTRIEKLAVVIPAHNEAAAIARCVRSVADCVAPDSVDTSIVVVADNCSDATAELARDANARVLIRTDDALRGKGFALRLAFETLLAEKYDAVLVVDADSIVQSNFLMEAVRLFRAGADGVQARYAVLNSDASFRTRLMNVAFMAFNILRTKGRERMGLSVGILGNGFGLTRSTLEAVPYEAYSLVEDLEYHLHLVQAGRKIVFANRTSVRADMPIGGRGVATQRARWEGGRLRTAIHSLPELMRGVIRGRVRLVEPALDLLLLPLAFHVTLLTLAATIPFGPGRIYALFALTAVMLHVATGIVLGGGDWRDFRALLLAPFYIGWKLTVSAKILQSARSLSPWVRTDRQ
jgi:cellulose synthase/poly-beta-1,6-N-acetylglucosamine synthase-like glycosyltransferase